MKVLNQDRARVAWGNRVYRNRRYLQHYEDLDENVRLARRHLHYGLRRVSINSKGNCLPKTLSHQMFTTRISRNRRVRTLKYHKKIRKAVVSQLRVFRERYLLGMSDEEYDDYVATVALDRADCDYRFERAAADVFSIRIVDIGSTINYPKKVTLPFVRNFKKTVTVCTIPGEHMDSLVPVNEPAFFTHPLCRIGRRSARTFHNFRM